MREVRHDQTKKRTKRTHHTSAAATGHHNLRPRPERNYVESANERIAEDLDFESIGDFLCDNEDVHTSPHKKRNGRSITRMEGVFARTPDMPKIKIALNEYGQPVGQNSRQLSSVIGCLVRKKLSVRCSDWRLIDAEKRKQFEMKYRNSMI